MGFPATARHMTLPVLDILDAGVSRFHGSGSGVFLSFRGIFLGETKHKIWARGDECPFAFGKISGFFWLFCVFGSCCSIPAWVCGSALLRERGGRLDGNDIGIGNGGW